MLQQKGQGGHGVSTLQRLLFREPSAAGDFQGATGVSIFDAAIHKPAQHAVNKKHLTLAVHGHVPRHMEVKALHETHGAAQHSEQATDMVPQAISRLLDMLLQNLSADVHHVVECITDGHSPSALAVLWRVRGRQSNLLHAKVHPLL